MTYPPRARISLGQIRQDEWRTGRNLGWTFRSPAFRRKTYLQKSKASWAVVPPDWRRDYETFF